jgi:mono/diheme cytochrome c family protein
MAPRSPLRRAAGLAAPVLTLLLVPACSDDGGEAPPVDPAAVAAADLDVGRQVYDQRCAVCHGRDGGGGVGPSLEGVADDLALDRHVQIVRRGREGMPSFDGQLSDDEILAVVRYERESF